MADVILQIVVIVEPVKGAAVERVRSHARPLPKLLARVGEDVPGVPLHDAAGQ
jgi:hypothetical protein